jgi:CheY-like chemotaxis protein
VAHDFNNLLMIMGSRAELIIEGANQPPRVAKQAEQIVQATRRAATLTRELLAFSRTQILQPTVLNLNLLVAELGHMLPRLIGEDIETRIITSPGIVRVKVDRGEFEQVIMNLAINARDSMPKGGQLTIETSYAELDIGHSSEFPCVKPGRYALLSVTDTGVGMDAETLAHIFEPFFTTKEHGKGTGLGLAMVYGIVEQSGGYISVHSTPGVGSTFKIYLPEVTQTTDDVRSEQTMLPIVGGSETILFVEDEEAVRQVGCEFLRSTGYQVLVAANGVEALELCRAAREPIDLLVTDLIMPQMGGVDLAREARKLFPNLRIIFSSGYGGRHWDPGALGEYESFLPKPFSMSLLAQKVRAVLDTPSSSPPSTR